MPDTIVIETRNRDSASNSSCSRTHLITVVQVFFCFVFAIGLSLFIVGILRVTITYTAYQRPLPPETFQHIKSSPNVQIADKLGGLHKDKIVTLVFGLILCIIGFVSIIVMYVKFFRAPKTQTTLHQRVQSTDHVDLEDVPIGPEEWALNMRSKTKAVKGVSRSESQKPMLGNELSPAEEEPHDDSWKNGLPATSELDEKEDCM